VEELIVPVVPLKVYREYVYKMFLDYIIEIVIPVDSLFNLFESVILVTVITELFVETRKGRAMLTRTGLAVV